MNSKNNNYKKNVLEIIRKYLPNCKVYLFGSRARNTHKEGADIDIALDAGKKIDFSIIYKITDDLEESLIPVLIDVIDYHNVSAEMKKEIDLEGIPWEN